jgi:thioredoxin reductase (NADPH)
VTIVHRGDGFSDGVKYWILPDIENRIKMGEVKACFRSTVREFHDGYAVVDGSNPGRMRCDAAFVLIGYVPDVGMLGDAGALLDPETLGPVYDPLTYETTVRGLYVAGSLAAGKFNNKIFIENGRLHGRSIVDSIARK